MRWSRKHRSEWGSWGLPGRRYCIWLPTLLCPFCQESVSVRIQKTLQMSPTSTLVPHTSHSLLSCPTHLSEVCEAHCDISNGMVYAYNSGTLQVASLVSGQECEADHERSITHLRHMYDSNKPHAPMSGPHCTRLLYHQATSWHVLHSPTWPPLPKGGAPSHSIHNRTTQTNSDMYRPFNNPATHWLCSDHPMVSLQPPGSPAANSDPDPTYYTRDTWLFVSLCFLVMLHTYVIFHNIIFSI